MSDTTGLQPVAERSLRVAMVTARALPFMGGIETHVEEVAGRLSRKGVELTVLTTDVTGKLPALEERNGFVVRRFPAWPKSKDYYICPSLVGAINQGVFDVVHVQGVHNAVLPLALATAQWHKTPTVVTFHTGGNSSAARNALRSAQWKLEGPLLRRAAKLIAVCEFEVALFERALGVSADHIALIRNGADPLPAGDTDPGFAGSPLVLSIGRLERYKGHHRAIAAMPALLRVAPDARLVIVGDGSYRAALRDQVRRLGLESAVAFTRYGPTQREQMGALVRSSDVVVLLSEYEAHPVAAMEALAEGVNVVVAGTSGLQELGRAGLVDVVELDAPPEEIARAVVHAARERRWAGSPPNLPTWDECAASLLTIYQEIA